MAKTGRAPCEWEGTGRALWLESSSFKCLSGARVDASSILLVNERKGDPYVIIIFTFDKLLYIF